MNALSKAIIAEMLCQKLALNKTDARDIIENFFEILKNTLEKGEQIRLSGFGNFNLRDKPERPGRNPKTGQVIPVVARRVVTFKPGLKLKNKIETNVVIENKPTNDI